MPPFGSPPQRRALRPSRRDGGLESSLRRLEIAINVAMLGAVDGRSRLSESLQAYARRLPESTADGGSSWRSSGRSPATGRTRSRSRSSRTSRAALAAVGLVALLRFWPSAAAAPFLSILGDRYRARARDGDLRSPARARDRRRGRDGAARRAAAAGDRARRERAADRDRVPARAGGAAAVARDPPGGAHGRERRVELDRERRQLRRPGARRPPARAHEHRRRLRVDLARLSLVGADGVADPRRRPAGALRERRAPDRSCSRACGRSEASRGCACSSASTGRRRSSRARSTS